MFNNNNFIWKFIIKFNCYLGVLVFIRFKLVAGRKEKIVIGFLSFSRGLIFFFFFTNHNQPQIISAKIVYFLVVLEFLFSISYWKYRGREYCPLQRDISKEFYENFYSKVYICISKSKTNIMHEVLSIKKKL